MKEMSNVLVISEKRLGKHLDSLKGIIDEAVGIGVETNIAAEWSVTPLSVGLFGGGCELASRNRGADAHVAPLVGFGGGIWAWLGFYQEWARESASGANQRYSYRSTTLSIHLGFRNIRHKPQIFRAEWAGWAKWNGVSYGAQAGNAGHPHWQFDAAESLRKRETEEAARMYLAILKQEEHSAQVQTFSPKAIRSTEIDEVVWAKDFSRIHFPSAAPWWNSAPQDRHVHFPRAVEDIEAWVQRTIKYTVEELDRLS